MTLLALLLFFSTVAIGNDIEEIVAANQDIVLIIEGTRLDNGAAVQSSGWVLLPEGIIATTAHQVDGVENIQGRLWSGEKFPLSVISLDNSREIALLRAERSFSKAAKLGDARQLRAGAKIIVIATPINLDYTVGAGIIANTDRTYRGHPVIQAELNAAPGSSGGPVFNEKGEVVGVIVGVLEEQAWATIIIPVNTVLEMLEENDISVHPSAEDRQEMELIPAPGITVLEMRALEAYNKGTRANTHQEKTDCYRMAVQLLPGFFEAWHNLAVVLSAQGETESAIAAYERALTLAPDRIEPRRNLGRLYLGQRRYSDALRIFSEVIALDSDAPQFYNDMGEAYRQSGDYASAAKTFQQAIALDDTYANAYYNLAITYLEDKKNEEARAAFKRYLALRPDAPDRENLESWMRTLASDPQP